MLPVRVLVVDDSVVIRKLLCDALDSSEEVRVVGVAPNGTIALAKIPQLNPDVITLDIEMPVMNGIETLIAIRKLYPKMPVIMFSALTERGAGITMEALSLGASDYLTKPGNCESLASAMAQVRRDLLAKIISLGARRVATATAAPSPPIPQVRRTSAGQRIDVLAIGSSTGGPNALAEIIPGLPQNLSVPVVVVQHMPPLFTRLLAERLNSLSSLPVREAEAGKILIPGQVWIAPGDHHMVVAKRGSAVMLGINQDAPENCCRPAVDVLFRSVAQAYGPNVLAVVLTGMGSDGTSGAAHIRNAGGEVVVQDEGSSVVWGMPGAVVRAGAADRICPLKDISLVVARRILAGRAFASAAAATAP